jgi:hypothetical protein
LSYAGTGLLLCSQKVETRPRKWYDEKNPSLHKTMQEFFINMGISPTLAGSIVLFILLGVISAVVGALLGRDRLAALLVNIYIGYTIYGLVPGQWKDFSSFGNIIMFLGILGVLFFFGWHVFDIHISHASSRVDWRFILICFLTAGLLLSIVLVLTPSSFVFRYISGTTFNLFASPFAQLFWFIAPIVFLFLVNKRR